MARKQLGKYDIIARLGRGGMAEVYKAYQASLDRHVAIKLLHPFLADDSEFKDRFEREARNVARLRHPNIVQVYDFEFDDQSESYFMVMELIEGNTLRHVLENTENKRLPMGEVLRIMRGAMEALSYAHARGMIHRDLKPANLMIDNDGRVVLTDFGIAKIVTGNQQLTASGGMVGTPAYMAPEQGLGEAGDERSDIYSMGVILFELATGELPFNAETPLATILKHLNEEVPLPRDLVPDMPPAVEEIILKAMEKDAEDRFQTADEMLERIRAVEQALNEGTKIDPLPVSSTKTGKFATGRFSTGRFDTTRLQTGVGARTRRNEPPPRRTPVWLGLSVLTIVALLGAYTMATVTEGRDPIFGIVFRASETPTATFTPTDLPTNTPTNTITPTETATFTPSNTPTETPTDTPTDTPTNTITPTETATFTPSNTPTETPTNTPSNTPTPTETYTPSITPTPTIDITATLFAAEVAQQRATATAAVQTFEAFRATQAALLTPTVDYTATARVCQNEFTYISPAAPNVGSLRSEDLRRINQPFEAEIVIRNTGDCDWLPGVSINYVSGERWGAPRKIVMTNTEPVAPGEDATFIFRGRAPGTGGLQTGTWEVRLADGKLVEPQFEITFFAYAGS